MKKSSGTGHVYDSRAMDTFRVVDYVRTSRGKRQQAEKLLLSVDEVEDLAERSRLLQQALINQLESIAALEQAFLAVTEGS